MTDIRAKMEATAEHLTGKVILVQFREPPTRNATGECYKTDDGLICIDIMPALGMLESYRILLHEAAHAKLHVRHVNPTPDHLTKSGAIEWTTDSAYIQTIAEKREQEADALATTWAGWAERIARSLQNERDETIQVIGYLTALGFYNETLA